MFSLLVLIEKTKSSYFIEEYFIPGIFIIFNEPNVMITLYKPRDTDINNILNLLTTLVVLFSVSVFKTFQSFYECYLTTVIVTSFILFQ